MDKINKKNCPYCNSEMLLSKKGYWYCSNICWKKEPYKTQKELEGVIIESQHGDWGDRD